MGLLLPFRWWSQAQACNACGREAQPSLKKTSQCGVLMQWPTRQQLRCCGMDTKQTKGQMEGMGQRAQNQTCIYGT